MAPSALPPTSATRLKPEANSKPGSAFADLDPPLTPWVADTVMSMGFSQMTPVQAHTIPLFLQNKDVVVEAVTGSGKTLAFVIPILERLMKLEPRNRCDVSAIVISPTRELASQTFEVFNQFLRSRPSAHHHSDTEEGHPSSSLSPDGPFLRAMLLIGGTGARSIKQDLSDFKEHGSNILVGTPGRLEEFLFGYSSLDKRKVVNDLDQGRRTSIKKLVNLKGLEILVLDEADRLLDLGFAPVLSNIMNNIPKQRRTGLFSATLLNDGLTELIRVGLRNPVKVIVKVQTAQQNHLPDDRMPTGLVNQFIAVPKAEWKMPQLIRLLQHLAYPTGPEMGARKMIIYFATCNCVEYFYRILSSLADLKAFSLHSLHGQQSPTRRSITFKAFKDSPPTTPTVLLCTDLVARGLDLPDIEVVIQYDPPKDVRNFFHRIGRTARAGRNGRAIVLLQGDRELDYVEYLRIKKVQLQPQAYLLPEDGSASIKKSNALTDVAADQLNAKIKDIVKTDRALHDRAVKAFVSFIQFYSKHEASYIFQLAHLDILSLAFKGFGLIQLPKMPELKKYRFEAGLVTGQGFSVDEDQFDWDGYGYVDPIKESNRLEKIRTRPPKTTVVPKPNLIDTTTTTPVTEKILKLEAQKVPSNTAWSNKINAKLNKEQRRLKRLRASEKVEEKTDGEKGEDEEDKDGQADWKELLKEEKALRKRKREKLDRRKDCDQALDQDCQDGSNFFDGLA